MPWTVHAFRAAQALRSSPAGSASGAEIVYANLSPTAMPSRSAHNNDVGIVGSISSRQQVDNGPHRGRTGGAPVLLSVTCLVQPPPNLSLYDPNPKLIL